MQMITTSLPASVYFIPIGWTRLDPGQRLTSMQLVAATDKRWATTRRALHWPQRYFEPEAARAAW